MQPTLTRLSHVQLTLHKRLYHLTYLCQSTQHNAITLNKAIRAILNLRLLSKLPNQNRCHTQIMTRQTRKQMMYSLEMQTTV
jgi:hypothetical protein